MFTIIAILLIIYLTNIFDLISTIKYYEENIERYVKNDWRRRLKRRIDYCEVRLKQVKLYRKFIRPMHCFPGQHYEPKTEPVEKEEKWYPEEERECLEKKYAYYNEGSFNDLVFDNSIWDTCD